MDGWKISFLLGKHIFRGVLVSFREGIFVNNIANCCVYFCCEKELGSFRTCFAIFWGLQTETLSNVIVAWSQQASKRSDSSSDEKRTLKLKKGEAGDEKRYPMGSMYGIFTYMKTIKINQM